MSRFIFLLSWLLILGCSTSGPVVDEPLAGPEIEEAEIVRRAESLLGEEPVTVTAFRAERSAGGIHDYYSEGRYWWPDTLNPDGPYVRRDGQSNPENFSGHKDALRRLSDIVTTLTAAYEISGEERFARHAIDHMAAWFVNPDTRMNPSLLYGQAIQGITTGRGIGIIDTLRLINVALSVELLRAAGLLTGPTETGVRQWFSDYGDWLTTHEYGDDERTNNNNHSTWWGAQVVAFARAAGRDDLLRIAERQYLDQLPIQLATDGSLPDEMGRTKPFHYLIYSLEGWATYAQLLSGGDKNYWTHEFETTLAPFNPEREDREMDSVAARTITLQSAVDYALPYLRDPAAWPYGTELEPEAHPHRADFLVFAADGLGDDRYLELWEELPGGGEDHHANLVLWQKINEND